MPQAQYAESVYDSATFRKWFVYHGPIAVKMLVTYREGRLAGSTQLSIGIRCDGSKERTRAYSLYEKIVQRRPNAELCMDHAAHIMYISIPRNA